MCERDDQSMCVCVCVCVCVSACGDAEERERERNTDTRHMDDHELLTQTTRVTVTQNRKPAREEN